jgi:succinate-semialdehyde dehydrogenase/glutarate-semialdehyde dehydrogenase
MQIHAVEKTETLQNRRMLEVYSPTDGKKIGEVPSFSVEEALTALNEVHAAQKKWAQTPLRDRLAVIRKFGEVLHDRANEVARLLSAENGKPLYEAYVHEVLPIVHMAAYFVKRAEKILAPKPLPIWIFKNRKSYIHYRPRGATFIISPWNFPFTIPAGAVLMNLIAGNGVLLKPASLTPLIGYKIRELFDEAGLDPKLFQVISGPGRMAEELIHKGAPLLGFVNFTGSTSVGKVVASVCGKNLIPCSMELGGKDPAIVCEDADIALAARSIIHGAFGNSGQICASVERVYAHKKVFDAFVKEVVRVTKNLRQDNPVLNSDAEVGAMTSEEQLHIVEGQLEDAVRKGANVLTGGKRSALGGMYFEPTVLTGITEDMEVLREETFGPLLPIMPVEDDGEAIRRANDSNYGLSAYVFTRNTKKGRRIAELLEAGTVMVNETIITHGFPDTPWQGFKESGTGKVHSDEGLRDLCLACHVNYDTMPIPKPFWSMFWIWHPYTARKITRFHSLYGLLFAPGGLGKKLSFLAKLMLPKPVK